MPTKSELANTITKMGLDGVIKDDDLVIDQKATILLGKGQDLHYFSGDEHLHVDPDVVGDPEEIIKAWLLRRFG